MSLCETAKGQLNSNSVEQLFVCRMCPTAQKLIQSSRE